MGQKKTGKKKFYPFISKGNCDYQIMFLTIALVLFGILMVYSTSSYKSVLAGLEPSTLAKKQAFNAGLGFIAMYIISKMNYRLYQSFGLITMIISIVLAIAVLFIGKQSGGAVRWIQLGPVQFQPSEIAKPIIIIYVAGMCSDHPSMLKTKRWMLFIMALPLINMLLVLKQNMSTAIVIFAIVISMMIVASPNFIEFVRLKMLAIYVPIVALVGFKAFTGDNAYRMTRIKAWLNPAQYPKDTYQTLQGLYAIGSGGLFGRGLGQSIQKTGNLPESHNDMIFAIVCEELGLVGGLILLGTFVLLIYRIMVVMKNTPDLFGGLIVFGVAIHISVQLLINIGVVTNTIPNTGVTLPFVSYGGSSLIFLMAEIGMVLSVSRHQQLEEVVGEET